MLFTKLSSKSLSLDVTTHTTLIDTFLKVNRIDDALKVLNTVVDASLRVVASFGNRVFDELIKNGKASDCACRFCPDPSKYHQGPRKWVGNSTHHLDPLKCLDHITHNLDPSNVMAGSSTHHLGLLALPFPLFLSFSLSQPLAP